MVRHLFVPIDGSLLSERAMLASIDLARQLGAAITGFIVEPAPPLPSIGSVMQTYERELSDHLERTDSHAHEALTLFGQRAEQAGVQFNGVHAHANGVDEAIVNQAVAQGCDMIVMVTHGRGAFGELLFGSHSKRVLSRTKLPVLVLH